MLQLLESLQTIIERFIVNVRSISAPITSGECTIPLDSSKRFQNGDEIVIYEAGKLQETGKGEIRTIDCLPDRNSIRITEGIVDDYPLGTGFVQKLISGKFIQAIYIGEPGKIQMYPAISINARSKENEWFTLESTSETFNVDITIYTEAGDYEESYRLMHTYAKKIETALFRSLYPLVDPADIAILAEDIGPGDTIFRITDQQDLIAGQLGWLFFESADFLRFSRVKEVLEPDVFELQMALGSPFSAGDKIIRPRRHMYNAFPRGISYGTINAETVVLKAAVISYMAQEEVRRQFPYVDPLTF